MWLVCLLCMDVCCYMRYFHTYIPTLITLPYRFQWSVGTSSCFLDKSHVGLKVMIQQIRVFFS